LGDCPLNLFGDILLCFDEAPLTEVPKVPSRIVPDILFKEPIRVGNLFLLKTEFISHPYPQNDMKTYGYF